MLPIMHGLHLTADMTGCEPSGAVGWTSEQLRTHCLAVVADSGLQAVGELFHAFGDAGEGVTGVVLLAESHLAVHTWPELGGATADVYVCNHGRNNDSRAVALLAALEAPFKASHVERHQLRRGTLPSQRSASLRPTVSPSVNASSNTE
jgi:S-adenosylmethionine decarboxylase